MPTWLGRREDHEQSCLTLSHVSTHMRLIGIEMDAIAGIHENGIRADLKLDRALEKVQYFLSPVRNQRRLQPLTRREAQLECNHLLSRKIARRQLV
jgi:hypothetical protein